MSFETISVFDMFKIGVGPSSSHTLGPWRAAQRFIAECRQSGFLNSDTRLEVELYGSLAKTGAGHGTDMAVILGLMGEDPESCNTAFLPQKVESVWTSRHLSVPCQPEPLSFDPKTDIIWNRQVTLPYHPNGMRFTARNPDGAMLTETFYSLGGGFIHREGEEERNGDKTAPSFPIHTAEELLDACRQAGLTLSEVVLQNERSWRSAEEIESGLSRIWRTMEECIFRGCHTEGMLPGRLGVIRRAAGINYRSLQGEGYHDLPEWKAAIRRQGTGFQEILKWVCCFALAVNEENAAFGRVVTAPTNGAAGVIPAVLLYLLTFVEPNPGLISPFLLTAGQIGSLFKQGATISAAMGGCQAEIGVSSAMAAAGLTQCLGGSVEQVLMAAEIAMEHHLGLTCDPVGGLVQVPCIERNTMGAVKAITACQIALESDPARAKVSLDTVIRTMWQTALEMNAKYKETSEGGLAAALPVSLSEC
jgi:L-serine dehydratase